MKLTIIVPTYNEKENLVKLISRIRRLKLGANIIIVDDNSLDGTGMLAEALAAKDKRIFVIQRKRKLGIGTAHKEGMKKALSLGAKYILTMDADLSHEPEMIPKMLEKLPKNDVVIGSKHTRGGKNVGLDIFRTYLSWQAQIVCKLFLGIKVDDSTSGFRCYKREALKKIHPFSIKSDGYSFLIELIYRCQRRGLRIAEVPITFVARRKGKSKISEIEILKAALTVLRLWSSRRGRIFRQS